MERKDDDSLALGGIYMFNKNGFQNMKPHAKQVLENIDHQVVNAFKTFPITKKGKDLIRSAIKAQEVTLVSDYQGTMGNDPGVHTLVVITQGGILDSFEERICVSEILGDKGQTDEDVANICLAIESIGVKVKRASA